MIWFINDLEKVNYQTIFENEKSGHILIMLAHMPPMPLNTEMLNFPFSKHRPSGSMLSISQNVHMFVCEFVCLSVC